MTRFVALALTTSAVAAATLVALSPVQAQDQRATKQVYEYKVEHPLYGDIGTYTNIVARSGDAAEVETQLRIAVKMLGIVVHREEAERNEHWLRDRLTLFHSRTLINGAPEEVSGEAQGNGFIITSPRGTVTAPATVRPSNPWSPAILDSNVIMSTKSGRLFNMRIASQTELPITVDGETKHLRRYEIVGDKRQFVWMDEHGVPLAFSTEEGGSPVVFVLTRYPSGEPQNWPGPKLERPAGAQQQAFNPY